MKRMLENPLEYPQTCRYEQFIALDDEKSPANRFSVKKKNYSECSMQVEILTGSSSHMHNKGSNKAYFTEEFSTLGFNNCLADVWGTTQFSGNVLIPLAELPFHSNGLGVQIFTRRNCFGWWYASYYLQLFWFCLHYGISWRRDAQINLLNWRVTVTLQVDTNPAQNVVF